MGWSELYTGKHSYHHGIYFKDNFSGIKIYEKKLKIKNLNSAQNNKYSLITPIRYDDTDTLNASNRQNFP